MRYAAAAFCAVVADPFTAITIRADSWMTAFVFGLRHAPVASTTVNPSGKAGVRTVSANCRHSSELTGVRPGTSSPKYKSIRPAGRRPPPQAVVLAHPPSASAARMARSGTAKCLTAETIALGTRARNSSKSPTGSVIGSNAVGRGLASKAGGFRHDQPRNTCAAKPHQAQPANHRARRKNALMVPRWRIVTRASETSKNRVTRAIARKTRGARAAGTTARNALRSNLPARSKPARGRLLGRARGPQSRCWASNAPQSCVACARRTPQVGSPKSGSIAKAG